MKKKLQLRYFSPVISYTFFFLLIFSTWSLGQDPRIVMVTEEWPPFRINDESSPSGFRGIDIDIVNTLSEKLGIKIEIQRHPWARALELMRSGQADLIAGAARTTERESFIYFIPISYSAVRPIFYTLKGKGSQIQSYQDLYGPSVGYSLNSAYFEPFDSDAKIKKMGLSTESQLLKVLALKRLDMIIGTDPNITYDVARLGYQEVLEPTAYQPPDKIELFVALSRKSPVMAQARDIELALGTMLSDGTINEIMKKYR